MVTEAMALRNKVVRIKTYAIGSRELTELTLSEMEALGIDRDILP